MSKSPKRSRHRVPTLELKSDPITPEYQAEIDRCMAKLEARYRKAQRALKAAEKRAERARAQAEKVAGTRLQAKAADSAAKLAELVKERRRELREIELLMMPGNYANRDQRKRTAQHVS